MNVIKRIMDLGTSRQTDPVYNKHIRFTNSVALFVCVFIVQNAALAIYYDQPLLMLVYILHFVLIALVPVFNLMGKRVLASAWFSSVAIVFVTFYAIDFSLDSYNFVFLSMIIFLQFFLFSASERKHIVIFTVITALCFVGAVLWQELHMQPLLTVPEGLLAAQRWNSPMVLIFSSPKISVNASNLEKTAFRNFTKSFGAIFSAKLVNLTMSAKRTLTDE